MSKCIDSSPACSATKDAEFKSVGHRQSVRQLWVRLSDLQHQAPQQSLSQDEQRKSDTVRTMDELNDRFGDFTNTFGSLLSTEEKEGHVISPAWRPGRATECGGPIRRIIYDQIGWSFISIATHVRPKRKKGHFPDAKTATQN